MSPERREEMQETLSLMKREVASLPKLPQEQEKYTFPIVDYRIVKPDVSTRCFFVRKAAEYLTGEKWDQTCVRLAFVAELTTCITYLINQAVDRKNGVTTHEKIIQNYFSAEKLKYVLKEYIRRNFPEHHPFIDKIICQVLEGFLEGEYLEKQFLTYSKWILNEELSPPLASSFESIIQVDQFMVGYLEWAKKKPSIRDLPRIYIRNYFRRTYLINTALYEAMVQILGRVYDYQFEEENELVLFARHYGIIQQLTNDIIDFVPVRWMYDDIKKEEEFVYRTRGKLIDDAFADLRNELLTLPLGLFLHLNSEPGSIIGAFLAKEQKVDFSTHLCQAIAVREMRDSEALLHCMDLNKYLAIKAGLFLDSTRSASAMLNDMLSITEREKDCNRYFHLMWPKIRRHIESYSI